MGILPFKDDQTNLPSIDVVFCSLLKRSCDTMSIILDEIGLAEKVVVTSSSSRENGNVEEMLPPQVNVEHNEQVSLRS